MHFNRNSSLELGPGNKLNDFDLILPYLKKKGVKWWHTSALPLQVAKSRAYYQVYFEELVALF